MRLVGAAMWGFCSLVVYASYLRVGLAACGVGWAVEFMGKYFWFGVWC